MGVSSRLQHKIHNLNMKNILWHRVHDITEYSSGPSLVQSIKWTNECNQPLTGAAQWRSWVGVHHGTPRAAPDTTHWTQPCCLDRTYCTLGADNAPATPNTHNTIRVTTISYFSRYHLNNLWGHINAATCAQINIMHLAALRGIK